MSFALGAALAAAARAAEERPAAPGPKPLTVAENTQAKHGELFIGVSYVKRGEYTDEAGAKKNGRTAGLRLHIGSQPPKSKRLKAYPGLRVEFEGYSFLVSEIKGGFKGAVVLVFDEAKKPSPKK